MRNFLTFIAVALVTALTVALVAPPLVDWSARREMVARAIATRIGTPVQIAGPIALRILPIPYLDLADVSIGPRAAPWLKGPAMRVEFSLFSLFAGKIRLDNLNFDRPTLRFGPDFGAPGDAPLEFAHIRARHAEVRLERRGASPILLDDLGFEGSASSTRGPYLGAGDFALKDGARANFQIAAGAIESDVAPLKAEFDSGTTRAEFDGRLRLDRTLSLAGTATISGEATGLDAAATPWRVEGEIAGAGDEVKMAPAEVRFGADARALEAEGSVTLRFGAGAALDADLRAKTLNFDSLLRREKEAFASPARFVEAFGAMAARALRPDSGLSGFALKVASQSAYLGARPLETPTFTISGAPEGAMRLSLETGLPGHGKVKVDGSLELGAAPVFRGRGEATVGDFASLVAWIAEGEPELAARLDGLQAALPSGAATASGEIEISPQGFSVRAFDLGVANSRFDGGVVYRTPGNDKRGKLFLDLASDTLDIEVAPNIEAGLDWLGDTDLDFSLRAAKLRVARVGLASVQGGSLAIQAKKDGEKFTLDKLSLADLGGASIEVEGETSPAGRWTRVKLDAGRLRDFSALLARVAPGPLTRWLQQRADDLGSAKATFEVRRDGPALEGPFPLDFLKADGEIAGARFGLTVNRAPAPVDALSADLKFDAPDAGALLRRLGAQIPVGPPGRAELTLSGAGPLNGAFDAKAKLALAGAEIDWRGALRLGVEGEGPFLSGPVSLSSADLFPALASLGMATAGLGVSAPAKLSADLALDASGARLSKLSGVLAGTRVDGDLAFAAPARKQLSLEQLVAMAKDDADLAAAPPAPTVTGALSLDRASASALLSLTLGRAGPLRPGAVWSESKFGSALLTPPTVEVGFKVGSFDFGYGVGKTLTGRLRIERNSLELDDATMSLNGGGASGKMTLRRDKGLATLAGSLKLQRVGLDRAALHAKFDAALDFAGAGGSAAALLGGLAGSGNLAVAEAKLPRLDADALARAITKVELAGGAPLEDAKLAAAIGAELDRGPLALASVSSPLALSSGALHFGPFDAPARDGEASVEGVMGLGDMSFGVEATLIDSKTGPFWSGAPPTVAVSTKGSLDSASRVVDASLLSAGLAAEAIARESDRIANFEADVRERAAFNRRFKAERFLARREAEIAAFEDERERRALMDRYLGPYSAWAASHKEGGAQTPSARLDGQGRLSAKEPTATGLY